MLQKIKYFQKFPRSTRPRTMGFKRASIVECVSRKNYHVWIKFDDGLSGEVNLEHLANKGIFKEAWATPQMFDQVKINQETKTLSWNVNGYEVDLDPYVLRDSIIQ